jgi:hypothetical protein
MRLCSAGNSSVQTSSNWCSSCRSVAVPTVLPCAFRARWAPAMISGAYIIRRT